MRLPAWLPRSVFLGGIALTAALFVWGGWERRWIADDGLIVLRTVRNLLAGNGPVFNAGERVEANTSTIWTYLVYAFSWLTQARLEYVVLGIALVLSGGAIVLGMLGTGALWRGLGRGSAGSSPGPLGRSAGSAPGPLGRSAGSAPATLLLPAGALAYIAVPPARDYATSGLESCLVIFWIALLWLLLVRWTQRPPTTASVLILAFVAGLGPLVRPELVILAGLALLMIFLAPGTWKLRASIVAVAGAVPVGYQIWRMGYYGLPYPNTAVAKDAGGAKWGQGFTYLWNLVGPYWLWLPLLVLAVAVLVTRPWSAAVNPDGSTTATSDGSATATSDGSATATSDGSAIVRWQSRLRTPGAVVAVILVTGLLLMIYSLRVGGDFMHGRVLLPVLFCFMLPIAVLPIRIPAREDWGKTRSTALFAVGAGAWLITVIWAISVTNSSGMPNGTVVGKSGIVDERNFYALNTGHPHPILAEDYLDYPRMRPMVEAIANTPDGGLLLPAAAFTYWDVVPPPEPIPEGGAGHTVYFLNLGMTSMNVGLDVKVIDQMGLAYPLAAHTKRLDDGRIGHDKALYPDWVVADTGMVDIHPWLPWYMDEDWVADAKVALTCPETQEVLASSRGELTRQLFIRNFKRAFDYAKYRFDRVPAYELQRCNLVPPPVEPR
ncbi:flagellar motor control protein ZomB [Rhodococcus sp. MTM3W5.2]|uniref:flagellar motor control protein ZomB n=1 Tax=Rhodococcus sp. MTM3W5.2 TaxID=1805827 RepID=UPI001CB9B134|nr:flagellar motor control protein ZomB [Rhodococcus sp. MTM3W5.2]